MLIADGDGQHRPADALRLVARLGDLRPRRRRARAGDAGQPRRGALGNAVLNGLASYLTERPIPDLTSGFRAARREYLLEFLHLLPNGFSTPTTTTLAFIKAGYNVLLRAGARRASEWARRRSGSARDGARFFLILLKVITIFSPLRIFLPISLASFLLGVAYAAVDGGPRSRASPRLVLLLIVLGHRHSLVGLVSEQISSLRFEGRRS